ncbi:protein of unknown function [Denitratisoma oestradiolicum]|uniref:Uncharacterized protein n=1 Tax=Denitratisoma oestradiolicum TaxID=311182 RepID=A0A6S6XQG1_9PROT|nr:protein of unknown function [Denitratisoma oestradiolicum]
MKHCFDLFLIHAIALHPEAGLPIGSLGSMVTLGSVDAFSSR